jgi:hypothetical protein
MSDSVAVITDIHANLPARRYERLAHAEQADTPAFGHAHTAA